jgi:MFS family permease
MRDLVVYLHVAGAFLFVLAHGASMLVAFRLRAEREPARMAALFDLSSAAISVMYAGLAVLLLAGIAAGFIGDHWGRGWIWASLGILVLVAVAMYAMATTYYGRLRIAAGADVPEPFRKRYDPAPGPEELDGLRSSSRPFALAGIGGVGLLVILWLMLFKPF